MRPAAAVPLALTVLIAATAFFRTYADTEVVAQALGAPFGVLIVAMGLPAFARFLQRRGHESRSAEPFWTPPFAWAAFAIALVGTLAQTAQSV